MSNLTVYHFRIVSLVFFLAFVARLLIVVFYPVSPLAGGDPTAFWSFAQGVASGQGFRSTFEPWVADRPPLYSYFLAGVFLLFGEDRFTVYIFQSLLGAIAAVLFYLCALRLVDETRALIAGLLFAFFPHLLMFTKQILTEALYIPLLVGLLAALLLLDWDDRALFPWLTTGILVGLLVLVRREALLPAGLVAFLVILLRSQRKDWLKNIALVTLVTGLVVSPWIIRNWRLLGVPTLSSSSGWNFMVGNNPDAMGGYTPPPPEWAGQFTGLDELERDSKAWELSLGWIRENPDEFLQLLPKKLAAHWGPSHNWVLDGADLAVGLLCFLGAVKLAQHRPGWKMIAAIVIPPLISVTLMGLIFVGGWRYRLAIYPGTLLLAAYGVPNLLLKPLQSIPFLKSSL